MGQIETNAWWAVLIGAALAVVLFVPVAAVSYRRSGSYSLADLLRTVAVPIYVAALGTYTLLPLPDRDDVRCLGRQTEPLRFVSDLRQAWDGSVRGLVQDPVFLQIALNVALFLPLGWFVRTVLGRGVVVATVLGAATSLLIESTQGTGLWGIYPCAYRLFDVDDLLINTAGATLGALVSRVLVGRRRRVRAAPRQVTSGRRLVALCCDALVVFGLGACAAVAWRGVQLYGLGRPLGELDTDLEAVLQYGVPLVVQAVFVLVGGRSVGEWVTELDTRAERLPAWVARPVKLLFGAGLLLALLAIPASWTLPGLAVFVLVTVGFAFVGDHRGLANTVAGLRVVIDQDPPDDTTSNR